MPGSATATRQDRVKKTSTRPSAPLLFTINEEDEQQKNGISKKEKGKHCACDWLCTMQRHGACLPFNADVGRTGLQPLSCIQLTSYNLHPFRIDLILCYCVLLHYDSCGMHLSLAFTWMRILLNDLFLIKVCFWHIGYGQHIFLCEYAVGCDIEKLMPRRVTNVQCLSIFPQILYYSDISLWLHIWFICKDCLRPSMQSTVGP